MGKSRISGKVAIVTGASNGIGRATAILLAKEGANVVFTDIQEPLFPQVMAEIKAAGRMYFKRLESCAGY